MIAWLLTRFGKKLCSMLGHMVNYDVVYLNASGDINYRFYDCLLCGEPQYVEAGWQTIKD